MTRDDTARLVAELPPESSGRRHACAVLGVAAGALGALRTLLGAIPTTCGAAFVVVSDEPYDCADLAAVLQPYTALAVRSIAGTAALEPRSVYLVPSYLEVHALDTHVHLKRPELDSHAPIDAAFRAAAVAGPRGIGAVLTGHGTAGTLGLRTLKQRGGLAIAQLPSEAEAAGMPSAAIGAGAVDLVLSVRDMPSAIARYERTRARVPRFDDIAAVAELADALHSQTGGDFSIYRRSVLVKHAGKRMRMHAVADWPTYLSLLRENTGEARALAADVRGNEAEFFACDRTFERLQREVLPRLFDPNDGPRESLRAWVIGCGTGEEAYSLAISLLEARAREDSVPLPFQLFATDIDAEALRKARLGRYPAEIATSVSAARLDAFFIRDGEHGYRVKREVRDAILFARHDVCEDLPFSKLDLVLCSGELLDRLTPDSRRAVLRSLHFALRPDGLLLTDSPIALDAATSALFSVDADGVLHHRLGRSPLPELRPSSADALLMDARAEYMKNAGQDARDARLLHLSMMERYVPASLLVDENDTIIYYSARAARFIQVPGGEVDHNVLRALREPLRSAVRGGLDAVDSRPVWASDALLVHTELGLRRVVVHVERVPSDAAERAAKVVVFEEIAAVDASHTVADHAGSGVAALQRIESELDDAGRRLLDMTSDVGDEDEQRAERAQVLDRLETAKRYLREIGDELVALDRGHRERLYELERLSADLEVLLESTGLATLFLDESLRVVRFTPSLHDIFDLVPNDRGRSLTDLTHRLRSEDFVADARRVFANKVTVEREVEGNNGKWYLMRMLPYRYAPSALVGAAITFVDITTRVKAEQDLREADKRKDDFIALLAHELRNPLAPISSGIEVLKHRDLDPATLQRITATMSRQTAQLVRLIDDLLDISRIRSGRLVLRKAAVELADIVRDAVAQVRPLIERARHDLLVDVPAEPIALNADAARITQVLANLLNNSARYTPPSGKIQVRARLEQGMASIVVIDDGVGMEPTALPRVFEMFYQSGTPRSGSQGGLGIGLALAKSLVELHGGSISAASAGLGRGSEFTLRLPTLQRAEQEVDVASVSAQASTKHSVLVVDDNVDAAQTLAMLIRRLGDNDVHVAASGQEGLALAQRLKPDTIFLDLMMPGLDGYEVARLLRREPWAAHTWLVALTGFGLEEHKRQTQAAGFDEHLTKPANPTALAAVLARPARF